MLEMIVPLFAVGIFVFGLVRKVNVYDAFIEGAKAGADSAFSVLPYLSLMIFAVTLAESSGLIQALAEILSPVLGFIGVPAELLPLIIMRPFSGGGSTGILAAMLERYGADSFIGRAASVYAGSSETLFYAASLYMGERKNAKGILFRGMMADLFSLFLVLWFLR